MIIFFEKSKRPNIWDSVDYEHLQKQSIYYSRVEIASFDFYKQTLYTDCTLHTLHS